MDHETNHINIISESFTSGCLRKFQKKHKSVETSAIKKWARQIFQGLCFLHTHDPPIIHGSLTCDNIFINRNTGEVKIGDPGLENLLQDPPLELFEELNEDFEIYLFGMCMLELATSQIPFSELVTVRDMYQKRIESGTMPDALAKVKDVQFRQFIEKCLVSGSTKVSTTELLKYSFLQTPNLTCSRRDPLVSVFELRRIIVKSEFKLKGEINLKGLILFKLRVDNLRGHKLDVEFKFDPQADTTLKVAREMIDAFALSSEDIILVAELMDNLIFRMAPCWKPLLLDFSPLKYSHGDLVPVFQVRFFSCLTVLRRNNDKGY